MTFSAVTRLTRSMSLGMRLGLLASVSVVSVMAALTGAQLAIELRAELRSREARLGESLAPLVAELQAAGSVQAVRAAVERFHASYAAQGIEYHDLSVLNASGQVVARARGDAGRPAPRSLLTAAKPLVLPALGSGTAIVSVTQDGSEYFAARKGRWQNWILHVSGTALLILALLFLVIRYQVTGPMDRLLRGIRKMELGYWDDLADPGGAWEVRWLGWRFRAVAHELNKTAEQLVAAQRRAYAAGADDETDAGIDMEAATLPRRQPSDRDSEATIRRLEMLAEQLRTADRGDVATQTLAQATRDFHAVRAARLGRYDLYTRLDDAALRVLDPAGFDHVVAKIEEQRPELEASALERKEQIHLALVARDVPAIEISHRVKHPAGIWRKMRDKDLAFEQVHDLVALRIVVPTEVDCYHALGIVHNLYAPIVGRFKDYIALPKPNGYRSLHVSVRDRNESVFEIQIRSVAMHQHAELGPAAHADYKDAVALAAAPGPIASWRRLVADLWSRPGGRS